MGTTPKPLTLRVTSELFTQHRDQFDELIAQGHDIAPLIDRMLPESNRPIHYLGPNCWRTLDLEYLDVTLEAIRKEVYEVRTPKPGSDDPKRPARARKSRARKPTRTSTNVANASGTIGD